MTGAGNPFDPLHGLFLLPLSARVAQGEEASH